MKHRIFILFLITIISVIYWFSPHLIEPEKVGLCFHDFLCESFWSRGVAGPILESFPFVIIATILLLFFSVNYLRIWLKIMIPYSIVSFALVAGTPDLCGGMICWDRTLVATGLGKIFLALTIGIVISKSIQIFVISRRK